MSSYTCAACRRPLTERTGWSYSTPTARRYCPQSRQEGCDRERRRLIRAGLIDLAADRAEIRAAMRRPREGAKA